MNAGKYDQIAGVAYGKCLDCVLTLETEEEAKAHRAETMKPGRSSHRTQATNRTREEHVQSMVDRKVEDAIQDAVNSLQREVDSGEVTAAEMAEALTWHSDFADEWARS